jgi:hypothetical protein
LFVTPRSKKIRLQGGTDASPRRHPSRGTGYSQFIHSPNVYENLQSRNNAFFVPQKRPAGTRFPTGSDQQITDKVNVSPASKNNYKQKKRPLIGTPLSVILMV